MLRTRAFTIALTAAVLATAAGAQASVVIATFNGASPSRTFDITVNGGSTTSNVRAGLMNWTRTGGDAPGLSPTFWTFCIELSQHVSNNQSYTYTLTAPELAPNTSPMGLSRADLLSELFGRFIAALDFSSQNQVSGFQLAIWEIVHDDGLDLAAGDFQVLSGNTTARTMAQNYLNAIDGTGPRVTLQALVSNTKQDQIIPTPGAIALLGIGGLVATRRRR